MIWCFGALLFLAACGGNGGGTLTPVPVNPSGLYVGAGYSNVACAQYYAFPVTSSSKPLASLAPSACGFQDYAIVSGAGFGRDGTLYLNGGRGLLKVTGGLGGSVVSLNSNYSLMGPISEDADGYLYGANGGPPLALVYTMSTADPTVVKSYSAPGEWGQAAVVIGETLYYTDSLNVYAYPLPLPSSGSLPDTPALKFTSSEHIYSLASDRHDNLYVLSLHGVSEYSTPLVMNEQPSFIYHEYGGFSIAVDSNGLVYVASYPGGGTSEIDVFQSHTASPVQKLILPWTAGSLAVWP